MKIYSLIVNGENTLAYEDDNGFIDLTRAITFFESVVRNSVPSQVTFIEELIWNGRLNAEYIGPVIDAVDHFDLWEELLIEDDYTVNPPVDPGKIIALGNNYREHVKEMNQKLPEKPVIFGKWPSTVIGHLDPILKPSWIGRMDYEAELAFIIGSTAKNVEKAEAMKYIAGYTCLNDVTARAIQKDDISNALPWMQSKNFDTFSPLGPCVLLADSVGDKVEIGIKCRVNGELKQNSNTQDFIFDIPTVIEYVTKIMTLEPGDIITTGTPVGVGAIEPGDTVEVECDGIGILINPVEEA